MYMHGVAPSTVNLFQAAENKQNSSIYYYITYNTLFILGKRVVLILRALN